MNRRLLGKHLQLVDGFDLEVEYEVLEEELYKKIEELNSFFVVAVARAVLNDFVNRVDQTVQGIVYFVVQREQVLVTDALDEVAVNGLALVRVVVDAHKDFRLVMLCFDVEKRLGRVWTYEGLRALFR